jgi:hypothetical protein
MDRAGVDRGHSVRLTADASGGLKSHSARDLGLISERGGRGPVTFLRFSGDWIKRLGVLLVRGRYTRGRNAAADDCTTKRQNTHVTEITDDRTVSYSWHPWAGERASVHNVLEKGNGAVARCGQVKRGGRILEIPVWMLDAAACLTTHRTLWRIFAPSPRSGFSFRMAAPVRSGLRISGA